MFYGNELFETPMLVQVEIRNYFESKQDSEESSISLGRKPIQESEDSANLPTLGSSNPELSIETLTWVVREVLEKVFEAKVREASETLQARCGFQTFFYFIVNLILTL
ncbi:hypothetical protein PVK06_048689 [Gossypium arboreum]|uniref:Uncharacterized protein n=1 Tax=Gossypium arboreum TaxID=29729 RepID=A0ABR0MGJ4_GOSAR|nr:hypothetical protein PVK06_048689 [Gossypium arboreum]